MIVLHGRFTQQTKISAICDIGGTEQKIFKLTSEANRFTLCLVATIDLISHSTRISPKLTNAKAQATHELVLTLSLPKKMLASFTAGVHWTPIT